MRLRQLNSTKITRLSAKPTQLRAALVEGASSDGSVGDNVQPCSRYYSCNTVYREYVFVIFVVFASNTFYLRGKSARGRATIFFAYKVSYFCYEVMA